MMIRKDELLARKKIIGYHGDQLPRPSILSNYTGWDVSSPGMLLQTQWERETGHYRRHFGTVAMSDSPAFGTFVPRRVPPAASFSKLSSDCLRRYGL
ncbi:hypothetical protein STEG23_002782 [Scotinomys teguina]